MKRIMVAVIALAALTLGACSKKDGPEVKRAKGVAATYDDIRESRDIIDNALARKVNCASAARHAFSKETGDAQVWTYRAGENAVIECYDTEGYHPTGRTKLRKITTFEVEEILGNPTYYPPPALPTPPRPASAPTPLPQLGEGPCCNR